MNLKVVAIIGILAAIGVPQYAKFQARARQSEARASLSAVYTAEQSFKGEWGVFSTNLRNIGFWSTGSGLRYTVGFTQATCTDYATVSPNAPSQGTGTAACNHTGITDAAWGNPRNTVQDETPVDGWTIDHNKGLRNSTVGI